MRYRYPTFSFLSAASDAATNGPVARPALAIRHADTSPPVQIEPRPMACAARVRRSCSSSDRRRRTRLWVIATHVDRLAPCGFQKPTQRPGVRTGWKPDVFSLIVNDPHQYGRSVFLANDDLPVGPFRGTLPLLSVRDCSPFNSDARRCLDVRLCRQVYRSDSAGNEQ